jgi:GTP-binding protein HflX
MQQVTGNTKGLSPSELRAVSKLYNRRVGKDELVSYEVARELAEVATQLRRRVGLLISREGRIEEVFLGSKDILYLPELGRYRYGKGRLRRLRFVFSDLSNKETVEIPHDVYGDLEINRFDAVVAIKLGRNVVRASFAHLLPSVEDPIRTEQVSDLGRFDFDFSDFIENLEFELESTGTAQPVKGGAILIGVYDKSFSHYEESLSELSELARSASLKILDTFIQRKTPDPKTLIGKGKLEEVVLRALRLGAEMLVFDCELRPSQWRMITNATELKVIDRSMLILDIFATRASTSEGRLQVELAQLQYNLPRLVEKDAGLSRLTGGIGGRGPGETKLEIGRRRIRDRITSLERKIHDISRQREIRRAKRRVNEVPVVAIVGYTNVGKSTLFNALTKSTVIAENKLFATLDTTQRRVEDLIFTDTVGFIRALPRELKNAFKATLEELREATLLLHVLDASDPLIAERYKAVRLILEEMELATIPECVVLNKIDKVSPEQLLPLVETYHALTTSAAKGEGIRDLFLEIQKMVHELTPDADDQAADSAAQEEELDW